MEKIPAYEAAVEALERLTTEARNHEAEVGCDDYVHAYDDAVDALRRLQEQTQ